LTQARAAAQSYRSEWRTSSYCQNSECAEVARQDDEILIRSTRQSDDAVRLTLEEWRAFARGIQAGEFEDLAKP
jgi:hypothetical protein